ncbi:hypothetical protein KR018_008799 [Drosophila ironensis]|nr:hypothetical protein KR018_008799 [Drosophila ironensis]
MFKRPYTPRIHSTTTTTHPQNTNQNPNQSNHHRQINQINDRNEDSRHRQAEANRIYHEEIVLKQAQSQSRARLPVGSRRGGSFVDQFTDFVSHTTRTTSPMPAPKTPVLLRTPTNAIAVSSLPFTSNTTSGQPVTLVSSNAGGGGGGNNGIKAAAAATVAKKTPVILLAARGAGKHAPISILNGANKAASVPGGVTVVRVNSATRAQRQPPSAAEEVLADDEEIDEELDEDAAALSALSSSTAQILRKFRIPKGTALTAKSGDSYLTMPTPTPSPPGVSVVSSAVETAGYIENEDDIIEELNEDDLVEEIIDEEACDDQTEELQETAPAGDNEGVDLSTAANGTATTTAATMMLAPNPPPLQLQTVAPNGTVTCFNLPANTILLQSADGSIIAATQVPHPSKAGQQQLIALPGNVALAAEPAAQAPQATQTLLLTADGTAIPILAATPQQQQHQQQQQQQQQQAAAAAAQLFAA